MPEGAMLERRYAVLFTDALLYWHITELCTVRFDTSLLFEPAAGDSRKLHAEEHAPGAASALHEAMQRGPARGLISVCSFRIT